MPRLTKLPASPPPTQQPAQSSPQSPGGVCLSNSTSYRQKLVFYDSSEELDKESPDADPWLPAWTPEGSPPGD